MEEMTEETGQRRSGIFNYFGGATINNLVINSGTYTKTGEEHHHYEATDSRRPQTKTEEEVKSVLQELTEAKNEKGELLLLHNYQWYAVYRVLNELCNYPKKMSDFCQKMAEWDMDKVSTPCKYASIRSSIKDVPKLSANVENWQQFAELSEVYKNQCDIANFLMDRINYVK